MYFHLDFKSKIYTSENKSSSPVQMSKYTFEGNHKYYPIWKHFKTSDNFSKFLYSQILKIKIKQILVLEKIFSFKKIPLA